MQPLHGALPRDPRAGGMPAGLHPVEESALLSLVTHELQTPVAIIKGFADTLLREDARWDQETIQRSLGAISEECARLQRLIGNLLAASALQAGTLPLHRTTVDLAGLLARAARRLDAGPAQGRLRLAVGANLHPVQADVERVEEVIYNLVDNAAKYTPPGGEILIAAQGTAEGALVTVTDQGAGIPVEDRSHIFERFSRSNAQARQESGTGLGLYICRAIVEAHGGRIWLAEPAPGRGAQFAFTLPYATEEEQHAG